MKRMQIRLSQGPRLTLLGARKPKERADKLVCALQALAPAIRLISLAFLLSLGTCLTSCEASSATEAVSSAAGAKRLTDYTGELTLTEDAILINLSWDTPPSLADSLDYSLAKAFAVDAVPISGEQLYDYTYRLAAGAPVKMSYAVPRASFRLRDQSELIELSHLAHWLPRPAADRYRENFTYSVSVHHGANMHVSGSGRARRFNDSTTQLQSTQPTTTFTVIVSGRAPREGMGQRAETVRYLSYLLESEGRVMQVETDSLVYTVEHVMAFYNSLVGASPDPHRQVPDYAGK